MNLFFFLLPIRCLSSRSLLYPTHLIVMLQVLLSRSDIVPTPSGRSLLPNFCFLIMVLTLLGTWCVACFSHIGLYDAREASAGDIPVETSGWPGSGREGGPKHVSKSRALSVVHTAIRTLDLCPLKAQTRWRIPAKPGQGLRTGEGQHCAKLEAWLGRRPFPTPQLAASGATTVAGKGYYYTQRLERLRPAGSYVF